MMKLRGSTNSSGNPLQSVNFDFGSNSKMNMNHFNPLKQFDHIGKEKLDQVCHCLMLFSENINFYIWKCVLYCKNFCNSLKLLDVERYGYYNVQGGVCF